MIYHYVRYTPIFLIYLSAGGRELFSFCVRVIIASVHANEHECTDVCDILVTFPVSIQKEGC